MSATPHAPVLSFHRDVTFLYGRARAHWHKGRYPEALQLLHLALEQEGDNPRLLLARARVLSMMGAFDLSRQAAVQLLAQRAHVEEAVFLLGTNDFATGDVLSARPALQWYQQRFPGGKHRDMTRDLLKSLMVLTKGPHRQRRGSRILRRALSHLGAGEIRTAERLHALLVGRRPEAPAYQALGALLLAHRGKGHEALHQAKAALLEAPRNVVCLCAMAAALCGVDVKALAPPYLRRAAAASSDLWETLLCAEVAGRLGLDQVAHALLLGLYQELPNHTRILQMLVKSSYNLSDLPGALHYATRYHLLDPYDPVANALMRKLTAMIENAEAPTLSWSYRWALPAAGGSFLSLLLPLLREAADLPEGLIFQQPGITGLLRWAWKAGELSDGFLTPLIGLLEQNGRESARSLLRELLLYPGRGPGLRRRVCRALARMREPGPVFQLTNRSLALIRFQTRSLPGGLRRRHYATD